MRLAAIQFAPVLKDPTRNTETAVRLATEAAEAGAHVIVLPELMTTGYSLMSKAEALPFAEVVSPFPGNTPPSVAAIRPIVQKYGVAIAWGFVELDPGTGNVYNSQMLLTPDSFVRCRKLNQWGNDFLWASEGRESPPILDYKGKRLGTLICRDIRDKGPKWSGLTDFYEKGDADIVCFSSNFGDGGFPSVSWVEFARDNRVWLVVSNRYGHEENNNFGEGGICIIAPNGKVHCEGLKWNAPCIVYADAP